MDYTDIITAIIAAGAALGGSMLAQSKATAILETKLDNLKEDLARLSTRVDKHNNVVERMTVAEHDIKHIQEELQRGGE